MRRKLIRLRNLISWWIICISYMICATIMGLIVVAFSPIWVPVYVIAKLIGKIQEWADEIEVEMDREAYYKSVDEINKHHP